MKQQKQLRNTLREYYDNQQVPFDDNDWERASAYLDAARRSNRIRHYAVVIGILVSMLFILLFHSSEATSHKKLLSEQNPTSAPASQKAVLPETRRNIQRVPADLSPARTARISETNTAVLAQDFAIQKSVMKEMPVSEATPVMSPAAGATFTAASNIVAEDIKPGVPEDPKENKEVAAVPLEISASPQNQLQAKEIPQEPADALPQTAEVVALNNNKKETAGADTIKSVNPGEITVAAVTDTAQHAPIAGTAPSTKPITVGILPDTASLDNLTDEGIFYEAGAAWLYGWKGPVHRDARGLSPVVGIHYMNRLTRHCAFSFGLQYLQVRNLSNSSKTSRVSSYVYGEQSNIMVITPSSAYYLLAPLRFHYYVDQKNSFGAGINLAYLLNVEARVTSYDESPGFTGNYKSVKLSGYTQGFSWFDSQLAFCYRRKIGSAFGLQTEVFVGLVDVKQDQFFGLSHKERNSGAKLSLVYYASRKKRR